MLFVRWLPLDTEASAKHLTDHVICFQSARSARSGRSGSAYRETFFWYGNQHFDFCGVTAVSELLFAVNRDRVSPEVRFLAEPVAIERLLPRAELL